MKFPPILPAGHYRDPALVYQAAEARTCKGCAHVERVEFRQCGQDSQSVELCGKGRTFGTKCGLYREAI
jgi:hypothetical protein